MTNAYIEERLTADSVSMNRLTCRSWRNSVRRHGRHAVTSQQSRTSRCYRLVFFDQSINSEFF